MYIVVVGAGLVGRYLAEILVEERHDVAIVDIDDALVRRLGSALDCLAVHGSGVSPAALRQAGIARADMVIAVTPIDEVNLVICMSAAKLGKNPLTVARVREREYLSGAAAIDPRALGLSFIVGPERATAAQVVDLLEFEGSGEIRRLAEERLALLELPLSADSPLVHETLAELAEVLPSPSLVAGVVGPNGFRIPTGNTQLRADERAQILTVPDNVDEFLILSGKPWHHVRHVLIIGCGTIGLHVARELESMRMFPTIAEINPNRADDLAATLTKSIVLKADGTDPEFLREQFGEVCDAVVVLMGDAEKAVLTGMLAKQMGAKKVIVRCDKPDYATLAHQAGIDALISPRRAVANTILQFVRGDAAETTIMLGDHAGQLIDINIPAAPKNDNLCGTPLSELEIPGETLIGAIVRGDQVLLGRGDTVLRPLDRVMVVCRPSNIAAVEALLS